MLTDELLSCSGGLCTRLATPSTRCATASAGSSDIIPDMNSERLIWLSPIKGVRLVFPVTDEKKRLQALVSQFCLDRSRQLLGLLNESDMYVV